MVAGLALAVCSALSMPAQAESIGGAGLSTQSHQAKTLDDIFAPVGVGTPTVDAYNGLFRCPDGEIRHYGSGDFLSSRDNGLTWNLQSLGKVKGGGRSFAMNPKTGTFLRPEEQKGAQFVYRSTNGVAGPYTVQQIDSQNPIMVRSPCFLQKRARVLFAGHVPVAPFLIVVFRSDDDGVSWLKTVLPPGPAFEVTPPHLGPRWENWCVEPTILEL